MTAGSRLYRYLLAVYFSYSILIGMTSYRHDFATNKYTKTKLTSCVALIANILTVLLLPPVLWQHVHLVDGRLLRNPVMQLTNFVQVMVTGLTILYSVLYRYKREKSEEKMSNEMLQIEREYLSRWKPNSAIDRQFEKIFFLKYGLVVFITTSTALSVFTVKQTWYSYALTFLLLHAQCIVYVTTFSYFLSLLFVCRGLCHMHVRLQDLLRQSRNLLAYRRQQRRQLAVSSRSTFQELTKLICVDLENLICAHWKLAQIIRQLNKIYRFQMLTIRFSNFTTYVALTYYGSIITYSGDLHYYEIVYGLLSYLVVLSDLYILDHLCDMLLKQHNEIAYSLRYFNTMPLWSSQMQKMCEQFSLRMNSFPLRVDVCGLFEPDKRLWFTMISATVLFTLVLVQTHISFRKD